MFFDMHADIWTNTLWEYEKGNKDIIRNKFLKKFKKGEMSGGIFVIWIDDFDNPTQRFEQMLKTMTEELYYTQDFIHVVKEYKDFEIAKQNGKLAIVLGIEGLSGIGKQLEYFYLLERIGIRHLGLSWNEANDIATGLNGDPNRGLTDYGIKALKLMNELKFAIDLSHANDKTFWDVAKYTTKPFFASHSNSRTLCPVSRNLTDEQLLCIKDVNGMVGLNSYHSFVDTNQEKANLDRLIDHLEYLAEKIGIDKVGFGLDFPDYFRNDTSTAKDLKGLKDATELDNIRKTLKSRGFSQNEIDLLTYKNFENFFKRVRD